MSQIDGRLDFPSDSTRYPGRHEVVDATLTRGSERFPVVVKRTRTTLKQRLGRTKAARSFETARALLARGLPTPEPIGFEVREGESWFVARRVNGAVQVRRWFLHRDDPSRFAPPELPIPFDEVVRALGRLARAMHDAGVFFRDFTDGNVLVTDDGGIRLWLVDLNRVRLYRSPLGRWKRCRDLARPGLNRREDTELLLRAYFEEEEVPGWALPRVRLLRRRIVLWDRLKAALRPWRKR